MTHRTFDGANSIEARQHLLDNRCERKHPKRHSTNRRRSAAKRKNAAIAKQKQAAYARRLRRYKAEVRAYWMGERAEHP